jgi:DNA topoisomerase II
MDRIDDDTVALLKKCVYDMAGTVKDVKVYLNDKRLKVKGFKSYVDMYLNSAAAEAAESSGGAAQNKLTMLYVRIGTCWELVPAGVIRELDRSYQRWHARQLDSRSDREKLDYAHWEEEQGSSGDPTFDSQTKETLTLPSSKFRTKPMLSEEFLKKSQCAICLPVELVIHIFIWSRSLRSVIKY